MARSLQCTPKPLSPHQRTPYPLHAAAPHVNGFQAVLLETFGSFMCQGSTRALVTNAPSEHLCLVVRHVHDGCSRAIHVVAGDFLLFLVLRIAARGLGALTATRRFQHLCLVSLTCTDYVNLVSGSPVRHESPFLHSTDSSLTSLDVWLQVFASVSLRLSPTFAVHLCLVLSLVSSSLSSPPLFYLMCLFFLCFLSSWRLSFGLFWSLLSV